MRDIEQYWDDKLHISTCGRDDGAEDKHHYPYEPTPYAVLLRVSESGLIGKENVLVDYGAGKGRAAFFFSQECGCRASGIEFNEDLLGAAEENLRSYAGDRRRVSFLLRDAERYRVPEDADTFWFFNPFSAKVLRSVIARITESYYEVPRKMRLFFYYPSDESVALLMGSGEIAFYDEIDCRDLFPGDDLRERVLIFET